MYNLIARDAELELLPCLRKLGISFYAYNPLGGGLLAGRYEYSQGDINRKEDIPQGRFTAPPVVGDLYRERYWEKTIFEAIGIIKQAINDYNEQNQSNLTLTEVAFRWSNYHSKLSGQYGDAILMGSSKPEYLIANTKFLALESPLPESILYWRLNQVINIVNRTLHVIGQYLKNSEPFSWHFLCRYWNSYLFVCLISYYCSFFSLHRKL